jgi:hypothetical protein
VQTPINNDRCPGDEDGTGRGEKMPGLTDVRILDVDERPGELVVVAETTKNVVYCPLCRRRAKPHDRTEEVQSADYGGAEPNYRTLQITLS